MATRFTMDNSEFASVQGHGGTCPQGLPWTTANSLQGHGGTCPPGLPWTLVTSVQGGGGSACPPGLPQAAVSVLHCTQT